MQVIAAFLNIEVACRARNREYKVERTYEIRTHKLEFKLFDYLSKFPLFGYKYFVLFFIIKLITYFED